MESHRNDGGGDFKAGENEYAQLGAEELYAQHKQDVLTTREVETAIKTTSSELPQPRNATERAVAGKVREHLGSAVERAQAEEEQHIEEAQAVSSNFIDEAKANMDVEMAQRNERLKTDDEIESEADRRIENSMTPTGALGPAEVLMNEPEKVRQQFPGFSDQDMKLIGEAIVRKVEANTGRTFPNLH